MEPGSAEWHARRATGIGGSEWGDVLEMEPYGCPRRLWYEKRGEEPDYPKQQTKAMLRGQKLESIVADEVAEDYHRVVRRPGLLASSPDLPDWWKGNPDRMIASYNPGGDSEQPDVSRELPKETGNLVIKTCNDWVFNRVKADGAREEHVAQVHHYLGLTGWGWGLLRYKNAASWEDYDVVVMGDDSILRAMVAAGNRFWRAVENGPAPDRLDASDSRCKRCHFRHTCQGEALLPKEDRKSDMGIEVVDDDELIRLVEQERQLDEIEKDAAEAKAVIRDKIEARLGGPRRVQAGGHRVYRLPDGTQRRVDRKMLEAKYPDVAADVIRPSPRKGSLLIYAT